MTATTDPAVTSSDATTKPRKRSRDSRKNEPDMYAGFVRRGMRALGRKISAGDVAALPELVKLEAELDAVILDTVGQLISEPHCYSWGEVAAHLKAGGCSITTRQGVQQKYGKRLEAMGIKPARKVGAQPATLR